MSKGWLVGKVDATLGPRNVEQVVAERLLPLLVRYEASGQLDRHDMLIGDIP